MGTLRGVAGVSVLLFLLPNKLSRRVATSRSHRVAWHGSPDQSEHMSHDYSNLSHAQPSFTFTAHSHSLRTIADNSRLFLSLSLTAHNRIVSGAVYKTAPPALQNASQILPPSTLRILSANITQKLPPSLAFLCRHPSSWSLPDAHPVRELLWTPLLPLFSPMPLLLPPPRQLPRSILYQLRTRSLQFQPPKDPSLSRLLLPMDPLRSRGFPVLRTSQLRSTRRSSGRASAR